MDRVLCWSESGRRRERHQFRQHCRPWNLPRGRGRGDGQCKRQRRSKRRRCPAGGQVGCNLQSGTLVYGLEGDLDYFHSNPRFINDTTTLADGNTFAVSQSLTTNFLATVRPRIGIAADRNLAYITGGAAFTRISYTEGYVDANAPPGAGTAALRDHLLVGP